MILCTVLCFSALTGCGIGGTGESENSSGLSVETSSQTATKESKSNKEKAEGYALLTALVHLRAEKSILSESLGLIEPGSVLEIFSQEEEWSRVRYGDTVGYVPSEYLEKTDRKTAESAASEASSLAAASEVSDTAETETAPPETQTSAEETTAPATTAAYTDPANGVLTDSGLFDLTGLSNKSVPYGNDWEDKDAKTGLANGVFWYEAVYGKYNGVYRIKTDEKVIYLTMDEGYEAGYTPKILDILKEKNVKAVFFITKQFLDSDPELVQRMIDEGHIIGNHTCNHPAGGYPLTVDEKGIQYMIDDVAKLHKLVYDQFGYTMKLFRFPEGESSELTLAEINNLGYTPVFWSYAHRDFDLKDQPDVSTTISRCVSHLATGSVYLLHACSESNTNALAQFIDQARAAGYEFGVFPVDEVGLR